MKLYDVLRINNTWLKICVLCYRVHHLQFCSCTLA